MRIRHFPVLLCFATPTFHAAHVDAELTCSQLTAKSAIVHTSWGEVKLTHAQAPPANKNAAQQSTLGISPLKWLDGRRSAVSITYDGAYHWSRHLVPLVQDRGLRMDYEVVTHQHQTIDDLKESLVEMRSLMDQGFHFFGHGHKHDLHDDFSESYVRNSFMTCFGLMQAWGLNPKAYAYPGSSATKRYVQEANRDAGFICARGDDRLDWGNYYILADDRPEPENWYFLPSVVMGTTYASMKESHDELRPILEQNERLSSWTIMMYHAIGHPDSWGYYPVDEFERDLDWLKDNDVWVAHLDQCCAYIKERARLNVSVTPVTQTSLCESYDVVLDDDLDDDIYDQELSLEIRLPMSSDSYSRVVLEERGMAFDLDLTENALVINRVPDGDRFRLFLIR